MEAASKSLSARGLLRKTLRVAINVLYVLFLLLPIYWLVTMSFTSLRSNT